MNELFTTPETKSPRLKWLDQHGIWTMQTDPIFRGGEEHTWNARSSGFVRFGRTEDEAIVELAKAMGITLWNES